MAGSEKFSVLRHWKTQGHVLVLIFLQIMFIVLFALFVRYDPSAASSAMPKGTYNLKSEEDDCNYIKEDQTVKKGNGTEIVKIKVKNTYSDEEGRNILGVYPSKNFSNIVNILIYGFVKLFKNSIITAMVFPNLFSILTRKFDLQSF